MDQTVAEITIRHARRQDLGEIVAIYNSTIDSQTVTADEKKVEVNERLAWFDEHKPESYPLWVAEDEGEIAGWLSLSKFNAKAAYRITAEIGIYIKEGFRQKGIGRRLLQKAIAEAPALGFECLVALVFAENKPSLKALGKHGFALWGNLPKVASFNGNYRDLHILGMHLEKSK